MNYRRLKGWIRKCLAKAMMREEPTSYSDTPLNQTSKLEQRGFWYNKLDKIWHLKRSAEGFLIGNHLTRVPESWMFGQPVVSSRDIALGAIRIWVTWRQSGLQVSLIIIYLHHDSPLTTHIVRYLMA